MRLGYFTPLAVFAVLALALGIGLTLEPRNIPSALIGELVPTFDLPPVAGRELGLASADLKGGEVALVNVFASWCGACRIEHPLLMALSRQGVVPVHGLAYKDRSANAARWLNQFGDPYRRIGLDLDGRVGIDWGVYGVPESFIVDGRGVIVAKHIGPITQRDLNETILPAIARARQR